MVSLSHADDSPEPSRAAMAPAEGGTKPPPVRDSSLRAALSATTDPSGAREPGERRGTSVVLFECEILEI